MAKANFRKGGGFLDNVVGVIADYQFTDEFNGEPFKPGKMDVWENGQPTSKKVDKPHSLNVLLSVVPDGAEEAITTTLRAANEFENWTVSEDGHVLTPNEDGLGLSANTSWGKLMSSLDELLDEGVQSDDAAEGTYDFTPILNRRVKFEQREDAERTRKFGKKVDKKTKRSYSRKDLIITEDLGAVDAAPVKTSSAKAAPAKSAPAASKGKPAKKDDDVRDFAKETLLGILAAADGPLAKNKLSTKVLTTIPKDPRREDVRKLVFDDDFLAEEDGWTYNKPKGLLALAE